MKADSQRDICRRTFELEATDNGYTKSRQLIVLPCVDKFFANFWPVTLLGIFQDKQAAKRNHIPYDQVDYRRMLVVKLFRDRPSPCWALVVVFESWERDKLQRN